MGTSNTYGGPGGGTPLIPSWLEPDGIAPSADQDAENHANPADSSATGAPGSPIRLPIPDPAPAGRFTAARNNFTRFAGSGGHDRRSLGRAVSHYVSTVSGGPRRAAQRMSTSRAAGGRLLGFLADVRTRGAEEALRALNLERLAGRPIEEIFLGLVDFVCPDGGSLDEGIAREAFIETIVELAENGITDLDAMTEDQLRIVFELYASHSIEARLCNDIGTKMITLPLGGLEADRVQVQLRDFIRRGVSDALMAVRDTLAAMTPNRILHVVRQVYEQAFGILQSLAEAESDTP